MLSATVSFAIEEKKDQKIIKEQQTKKEEIKFDIGEFEYKSEGRRDPFEPVLLLKQKAGGKLSYKR